VESVNDISFVKSTAGESMFHLFRFLPQHPTRATGLYKKSLTLSLRLRGVARHEAKQEAIRNTVKHWIASLRSQR
jgi:hypothetical protein